MRKMSANLAKTFFKSCLRNLSNRHQQVRLASTAGTFKAAVLKGPAQPLVIEEKKQLKLDKNDVRIKVHYCSVNSIDCATFRSGVKDPPFVPGYELSGEVLELGQNVTNEQLIKGERVAALSLEKFGGFAEECVINVNDCFKIPTNVTYMDAAVLICGHSTAIYAFSSLHQLQEGDVVAISVSAAGLGLAAIDVAANMYKAKVIAVTADQNISEIVRQRGAFSTVVYSNALKKDISKLTDKKGAAVIYDAVGDFMIAHIGSGIAPTGRIFHAAPAVYSTVPAPPPNSSLTIVSLHALREQNFDLYKSMVTDTLELAHEGIISSYVSAQYKLADVNEAIEFIEAKKCTGKVVIEMDQS